MKNLHDKIESYLLKELPETELAEFEQALQPGNELSREVAAQREVILRLEGLRLRQMVTSSLQELASKPRGRSWWWILLLLVAGVGVMAFLFSPKPSQPEAPRPPAATAPSEPLAQSPADAPVSQAAPDLGRKESNSPNRATLANKYQAKPSATLLRSAAPTPDKEKSALEQAHEAYHQGQYRQALKWLENTPADEDARYYRANALFRLNRFAEAEAAFNTLETSFQYQHEARWNHFLCRLASGKIGPAQAKKEAAAMAADERFELRNLAVRLAEELSE